MVIHTCRVRDIKVTHRADLDDERPHYQLPFVE
jgi:hypothetical protein